MGCTTVIVGKRASINNSTMIARNCDAERPDVPVKWVVVPAKNEKQTFHSYVSGADIPLPTHALRYQMAPFVNYKKHGQFGECGINSANVAMSATESIYGNPQVLALDPLVATGIGEDALLSIVLPFIHSAREGVEYLGKLIAKYGSHEGNGIIFSDKDEVWYMEIPTGHYWVASKLADDKAAVIANQVSQQEIDFDDSSRFLWADGIQEFVKKNHLNPDPDTFNFRRIFGTSNARDRVYNTPRVWFGQNYLGHFAIAPDSNDLDFSFKPNRKLKREDVAYVLSSHYNETQYDPLAVNTPKDDRTKFRPISMARCAESHILEIRSDVPEEYAGIAWFNSAPTAFNPYVPFYSNANDTASAYNSTSLTYDSQNAYWLSRTLAALIQPSYNEMKSLLIGLGGFLPTADQLTDQLVHDTDAAASTLSGQKLTQFLTQANEQNATKVLNLAHETVGKLVDKEMHLSRLSFSINTDRLQN
ncbi:C69 family dipeptidase [Lactobacillus sp. PV037]|uniref:C69 family dipeptidase n=1 Tax=unclassified Lactobacillus TaxID=2620435 RepID=UPI00223F01CF|nr:MULTISPECIES: C69 family dipeptidase [unclassified Lactobacillus]QNQ82651.1 C69 family dipeptidase [Lactobacillus sp. PV012]QNQ83232.1 C69 family dipeptidase [Lactobacillus sp. PV037]